MKTFRITGPFLISFILEDEQRDILFDKDNPGLIEATKGTVWYVDKDGKRYESITTANVIDVGLENKALEEVAVIDLEMNTKVVQAKVRKFGVYKENRNEND